MSVITIDFETRSPVNLKDCGVYPYFAHPDTEFMCLAAALNAAPPVIWIPRKFERMIDVSQVRYEIVSEKRIVEMILSADEIVAQSVEFEYTGWNHLAVPRLGWPPLPLEKLHDTKAQLCMCALPASLGKAGQALGLSIQKDDAGHKAMLKLCKPRRPNKAEKAANPDWAKTLYWNEDPNLLITLFNYCCIDVESERLVCHTLPKLPPKEREIWLMDQRINMRGVPVDVENVKAIVRVVAEREEKLLARFQELVGAKVSGPLSYVKVKEWVNAQTGLSLESVDKNATAELLKGGKLPPHVHEALQIKSELSKSSVAKFRSMLNRVSVDGRLRGMFLFHGAATSRWTARGVQLHNQPRDSYGPRTWESVAQFFREGDADALAFFYEDPFYAASKCVRGAICTQPGRRFICADFSSVEARAEAHLAGEESVVEAFLSGKDLYKVSASTTFNVPYEAVDKTQRQVGKTSILALGYGGGIGAYAKMAKGYNIDLETLPPLILPTATTDELGGQWGAKALAKAYLSRTPDAEMSLDAAIACDVIKRRWRAANPNTVRFWKGLGEAAYRSVENPGQVFSYRDIKYVTHGGFLKCLMPSGRIMYYYDPQIRPVQRAWDLDSDYEGDPAITFMGMKVVDGGTTRQWARLATYGAKLAENCIGGAAEILTPGGWICLDEYQEGTQVWDGEEFVAGGPLLDKGVQPVIAFLGVEITPDHEILTDEGWREANEAHRFNRTEVSLPDSFRILRNGKRERQVGSALRLWERVCGGWRGFIKACAHAKVLRVYDRENTDQDKRLPRAVSASGVLGVEVNAGPMPITDASSVAQLRRAGYYRLRALEKVHQLLGRYGRSVQDWVDAGATGQREGVLARKLLLGDLYGADEQQTQQRVYKHAVGGNDRSASLSKIRRRGNNYPLPDSAWLAGGQVADNSGLCQHNTAFSTEKAKVYDIQNCGPRHQFVVRGRDGVPFIAHNCTQGYCRDLLAESMLRVEAAGYPVVLHVHDEAAAELPDERGSLEEFNQLMAVVPPWAAGMPLAAEGWSGARYKKG